MRTRYTAYALPDTPLEARKNHDGTYMVTRAQGAIVAHAFRMPGRRAWFFVETDKALRGVPEAPAVLHGPHATLSQMGKHVWSRYLKRKEAERNG